jgi:hypothetical protein
VNNRRRKLVKAYRLERKMRDELLADPMLNYERFLRRLATLEALQVHILVLQS